MPNQWLKPVLTYKYPTLALPSYLIIYWLRQERFYDRQHNALMWATRVSNSLLPRLCWCMLIFLGPSSQQAARLQRDPGGRMHCTHGASHDPRVSFFLSMSFAVSSLTGRTKRRQMINRLASWALLRSIN